MLSSLFCSGRQNQSLSDWLDHFFFCLCTSISCVFESNWEIDLYITKRLLPSPLEKIPLCSLWCQPAFGVSTFCLLGKHLMFWTHLSLGILIIHQLKTLSQIQVNIWTDLECWASATCVSYLSFWNRQSSIQRLVLLFNCLKLNGSSPHLTIQWADPW